MLNTVIDWTFLQEPLWRWTIFFGAMMLIAHAYHGVLDFLK